jgi:integrase
MDCRKDNTPNAHSHNGLEEENSRLDDGNEQSRATNDHSGTAREDPVGAGGGGEEDGMVNIDKIIERFKVNTSARLKPRSQYEYLQLLERFDWYANLETRTKKDLTGRAGKVLILEFMQEEYSKRSWRYKLAMLKTLYIAGFGYSSADWPIEPRRDLGRLPRPRPNRDPPDEVVKAWAEAFQKESRLKPRMTWLLVAQTGWSPSDVVSLTVPEIKMKDGKPHHIERDRCKTGSPIVAFLPPDLAEELASYLKTECRTGPLFVVKPDAINSQWKYYARSHGLEALHPKDMRHWVASACRKAGMSKQASAYLMGHDATSGGAMRDWYDQPQVDDILAEQAERLPYGPLGILLPPRIELVDKDTDILVLWTEYMAEKISTIDFANKAEELRMHRQKAFLASK